MVKRILLRLMRLIGFTAVRIGKLDAERNQALATARALHEAHVARDQATAQLDQERLLRHSAEAVRDETARSYGEAERALGMVRARESTLESLIGHLENSNRRLQQSLDAGLAEIDRLQAARRSLRDEIGALRDDGIHQKEVIERQIVEIDSLNAEIGRRRREMDRLEAEMAQLKIAAAAAAEALVKEAAQRDILAGTLKDTEFARDEAISEMQRAGEARRALEDLRVRDLQSLEELKSALAQARAAGDALEGEIRAARERVTAAESAAREHVAAAESAARERVTAAESAAREHVAAAESAAREHVAAAESAAHERVSAAESAVAIPDPAIQAELAAAQAAYSRALSDLADTKRSLVELRVEYLDHLRRGREIGRRPQKAKPAAGSR
ncbi:MAG: hypothetical protein HY059_17760 [Proteobacteria bacterium]|nr:hypothetical protein [Pseudomonadota bacterium]